MLIEQIFIGNTLRNFNYIIACPVTLEALVLDPLDAPRCLDIAQRHGWQITQVVNTHEHADHTAGNAEMAALGIKISAHADALSRIPYATHGLKAGDRITIGKSIELSVLDTPGHTLAHICLSVSKGGEPALFSGDTLFNGGCGNCHSGNVEAMYQTVTDTLLTLPDNTRLYPGHDYLENNLKFALSREPQNRRVQQLLNEKTWEKRPFFVTTLGLEKEISPFFRLQHPEIREKLGLQKADDEAVFSALRALRDKW